MYTILDVCKFTGGLDESVFQVNGRSLRKLFSVVTQDSALFNGTIRENIEYGRMGATSNVFFLCCGACVLRGVFCRKRSAICLRLCGVAEEILTAAKQAELVFDGDLNLDKVKRDIEREIEKERSKKKQKTKLLFFGRTLVRRAQS